MHLQFVESVVLFPGYMGFIHVVAVILLINIVCNCLEFNKNKVLQKPFHVTKYYL